ncbi:lipoprotein-releasing ABC transporter ATP-binding protein LolD [Saccharophagus degradans]|uniref:Lipoprotein-releasing system ATP-binding protein LolD n=2 Tax=Saccharophagus degradans TaxID=86304 RepID=LOLD_SACD2|nr:lipoprotein-releasing ABC transporter ATP-binding protein LolD [Saccharophagus degradans]Q21JQ9.1 RecName: Full=Lipoprotein-releasing system ATP-binding protein LolD [Saccharophagus degradans 2-40]ABD81070.1 Lipoprotein releasing system, ATP-binding protein [Saccharophagus degradans 2-40]MBU2984228.1 lipoprotein-releasing ABC transporter ATP-binding protein LolD [Saccharophagus degradans]MDO6424113.1 lipoprotein-releasing ABC transporter ATP-binding protein LolD [Saccharophagus degradans]MD
MSTPVIKCLNVVKGYSEGPQKVEVLRGVNLQIEQGQHIAIVGASGSGKSTLLNVLGGLDKPDAGEVWVNEKAFSSLNDNKRGLVRNQELGFVYQFHHLLPEFTALENVMMPCLIAGVKKAQAKQKAEALLDKVGLSHRLDHKPAELSGGERQRVAIARALVNEPACVLMDEPTGNLDTENAESIQSLMKELSAQLQTSFIVVTHDLVLANTMNQVYRLEAGVLNKQGQ